MSHARINKITKSKPLGLSEDSTDLLKELNTEFLTQHVKTGQEALKDIANVIIFKSGSLSLYSKEDKTQQFSLAAKESTESNQEDCYTQIKRISHVPLLVFDILDDTSQTDEEKQKKLGSLKGKLILINLDITSSSPENKAQKCILEESIKLLSSEKIGELQIFQYKKNISRALSFNKKFVTKLQLESIESIINKWIKEKLLQPNKSRGLVVATHGPRDGLIEMQYFVDFYKKIGVNHPKDNTVYYIEELPQHINLITDKELINEFLASSERNKQLGRILANNPNFMFRDVLADSAPAVLSLLGHKHKQFVNTADTEIPSACPMSSTQYSN